MPKNPQEQSVNSAATEIALLKKDVQYMSTGIDEIKKGVDKINETVGKVYATKEELTNCKKDLQDETEINTKAIKEIKDAFSKVFWIVVSIVVGAFVVWALKGGLSGGL